MPMILSLVYLPSYAKACVSIVDSIWRREPYLAIVEDKAETSGDRLEWAEGIRGVPHSTEEQLGRGRRSRFPVRFPCFVHFAFAPRQSVLDILLDFGERLSYLVHVGVGST